MNENFIKVMYPPFPSETTHVVLEKTFYYDASGESIPPIGKNPKLPVENIIESGDEVTLIEYGLGYNNLWSKVLLRNGEYAYLLSSEIEIKEQLKEIYTGVKNIPGPLYPYNNSKDYLPDYSLNKINWKDQQPNIAFEDKYTGKLCVHYEYSDVTEVSGDNDLKQKIREACYTGTRIILESKGINISDKLLFDLVDNFYTFSKAEEYFFAVRNCSTLRVLVTLPIRFLYAANILLSDDAVLNPEDSGEDENESGLGNSNNNPDNSVPPENTDSVVAYNSKEEMDIHFSTIAANLVSVFSLFTFPPSKSWTIEPRTTPNIIPGLGAVNLLEHQQKIGDLHKEINEFIYNNLLEQSRLHNDGLENYKKVFSKKQVDKNDTSNWFSVTDLLTLKSTKCPSYNGKVQLVIDNVNLVLKDIKFYTEDDKEIVLNVGKQNFLNKEIVKNKTCLNYLCKIQPYTRLANEYESWNEEYDTLVLKLSNSDKLIKVIIDEIFSVKTNRDESELRAFLINNHYPSITSVSSIKLPLSFSCTDLKNTSLTIEKYLATLRISESPREKLRAYNQLVRDVQNSVSIEGNNFNKYINNPNTIENRNFKILLGMADLAPDQEFAINQFIAAASTIDWPRYLQDSVKCAGIKFDPRTFTDILNEFDRARQLLEDCNPSFSINLLNQLANFSLPDLPDYNPNLTLVEDLKNLVLKIIKEALVFVIRKLIEDALKACMSAMAEKGGANPTSEDLFPDGAENEAPRANLNNLKNPAEANALMKDFLGVDSGSTEGANPNNDLDNAKALLQDMLADIMPCLSVREMCDLLSGRTLNNDIYNFIISLLNKKYNFKTGNVNLALKLNSKEQIQIFFKKLGSAFNLNICSDLLDNLEGSGRIPGNPLCDDGSRKARQKEILENKGLSPEQIDNLINELQNEDEKNLRDILGFLNSPDTPFDLNNIPTVLCKKGPNGETIPPAVSLAPPMKTFGKVLDSIFKPVYDNFDSEAMEWYKNTYSTISSANKNHISFVKGKLVIKPVKGNPSGDEARQQAKDKLKLNYLFDNSYKKITFINNTYNFSVDGYEEQKLETELASKGLRDKVIKDNTSLYNYLDNVFSSYEDKLVTDPSLKLSSQNSSVQQFFSLATSFYASNMSVIKNTDKIATLKNIVRFNDNDIGNALYAESISLPIRDSIVQSLQNPEVKAFLSKIYAGSVTHTAETFDIKEYTLGLGANNLYTNYDVSLKVDDKIQTDGKLINDYSLIVKRNGINFIDTVDTREVDASLLDYLKTFNAQNVNSLSKQEIFNRFITKKKEEFGTNYLSESLRKVKDKNIIGDFVTANANDIGTANYAAFSKLTIKEMGDEILSSPFSKTIKIPIETDSESGEFKDPGDAFLKPPDLSNPEQRESSAPATQYMTLVIPQTPVQKACNIRPHYLDIDQIKEDLFKDKEEAFCIEEIKNEKILQGKEVDTQELADSPPTDTQSILLDGGYRLIMRVYLHDLMLRAISIFGVYDPQSLRNDDIFHAFMIEMIEAEMRSRDNTVFNMMNSYYSRQGITLKQIAIQELKTNVLPKMAKRINEDTNEKLAALNPPQKVILRDIDGFYYNRDSKLIKIDPTTKSVYVRVNGTKILQTTFTNQKSVITLQAYKNQNLDFLNKYEELIFYQKIFTFNTTATQPQQIIADIINEFKKSNEFKLLFDFLIPKKEILTFLFISNVLCNSSNKKRRESFEMTKSNLQNSLKFMATSGAPIKPNPNNYQDMKNSDTSFMFIKFILMAAISAPISIVKGYTELTEPNISLSANIYRLAKSMIPETPSLIIPAMSLPLGIPIPPVFPLGIIPWVNIPLCLFYLITGIWLELPGSNTTEKDKKTSKDLLNKLSKGIVVESPDCSTVFNPDIVKMSPDKNGEFFYDVSKPSPEFITADAASTQENTEKTIIKDYQIKQILRKAEKFSTEEIKQYFVALPDNKGFDQAKIGQLKSILSSVEEDLINDLFESGTSLETNLKAIVVAKSAPKKQIENVKKVAGGIKDLAKNGNIITSQIINEGMNKQMKDIAKEMAKSGNVLTNQVINQNVNKQTADIIKDVIKDLPKEAIKNLSKDIIKDLPKETIKVADKQTKKELKEEKTIKPTASNKKVNPRKL